MICGIVRQAYLLTRIHLRDERGVGDTVGKVSTGGEYKEFSNTDDIFLDCGDLGAKTRRY